MTDMLGVHVLLLHVAGAIISNLAAIENATPSQHLSLEHRVQTLRHVQDYTEALLPGPELICLPSSWSLLRLQALQHPAAIQGALAQQVGSSGG